MQEGPFDMESCLRRVGQGDEAAARALVAELHPLVMRIVQSHLPVRGAPEDLAQEIYVRLFRQLPRYEPRTGVPFVHWVSRMAVRVCLDALRAERRRPEVREADAGEAGEEWLEYLVGESEAPPVGGVEEARGIVTRLLERLEPADRMVITWLDLEEKTVAEVSRLSGWSAVGVRVRAFRARRRLRRVAESMRAEVES